MQTNVRRLSHKRVFVNCLLILALVVTAAARSETAEKAAADTEALKYEAVDLISRLHRLEQKLLYPAHTRVSVFLSAAQNSRVDPHSVSLEIDNNKVTDHMYTQNEASALRSGGIQRLHTGNMLMGKHGLQVSFKQVQKDGSVRTHELEYKFDKGEKAEYIEIIVDSAKPYIVIESRN
jgi:hypothetical protein